MAKTRTCLSKRVDRISSLPDPLLIHILSMLPTRCALPTSLLSSRWRYLWTSVTNIDIVDVDFICRLPQMSLDNKIKAFTEFVNRVLHQLNSPCIHNFHLGLRKDLWHPFHLDSWISSALERTVQELHLVLEMHEPFELTPNHFDRKTTPAVLKLNGPSIHFNIVASSSKFCPTQLQTLHLSSKVRFTISSNCSVTFPSLTELYLDRVDYSNDESSLNKLLASCPVLDNLYIVEGCVSGSIRQLVISIPSLTTLKLIFCCRYECSVFGGHKLHIDTPSLSYLYLSGLWYPNVEFTTVNLSSLIEARVKYDFKEYPRSCTQIFSFLGALFNVKFLSLSGVILTAICSMSAIIEPTFCNLSRLELERNNCQDWSVVINLLGRMVNLEHIILKGGCYSTYHESWWTEPSSVPMCLLQRVTTISFMDMIGNCPGELELVRFFLNNAKVLRQLVVHIYGNLAEKFEMVREISMMTRGSQACRVVFE